MAIYGQNYGQILAKFLVIILVTPTTLNGHIYGHMSTPLFHLFQGEPADAAYNIPAQPMTEFTTRLRQWPLTYNVFLNIFYGF